MVKEGKTHQEIAFVLARPPKSIFNEIKKFGGREGYSTERAIAHTKEAKERVKALWSKPFTQEERDVAKKIYEAGGGLRAVRDAIKTSYSRARRLINEVAGVNKGNQTNISQTSLWNRVYALEEQVNVLFELLGKK